MVWSKALLTEASLRQELVWHKRLPAAVTKDKSAGNLIKVLLRASKLYSARANAIKILTSLLRFKAILRGGVKAEELQRQAQHLRSMLLDFKQEQRIFGPEFIYQGFDMVNAFLKI